ncbi:MAG: phosphoglycerate dehydrogenase [Sediminibacterium sp. Gen4]|jgi:D-3-phosphoglycerate dehydrogenase / 2-oxoglutarate reductase|uniref:phosphoglycerate dehydrogenase n=1 Tax=unclassified Sediminibacterium TaxID=2635961 RepID=UPI0015BA6128|nr:MULTISPECIES: phosphoglycerate dehydrogenase [unclassified Sediminibacterium]MBW0162616.1 phosphoglycerate dehydrogenase [Sediminibacterium sp.]MBW0164427.1 phosphoglycerate dehydrogenase [Sediminibacterium sp.]NWK66959.1 phosphoglycerate dehydrogenase [Sediminibacterium sp. Gen4]
MSKTSYPKERINILFLENISDKAVQYFKQQGYANVKKIAGALSEEELVKEVKDVHLLGIRSKTQITPKVLEAAKKLQAIGCFCIGVNQVDLKAATKKGVVVFNAPYSNTRSVAELVIGISVMLIRKISDKNIAAHKGIWMKDAKGSYELRGKTMGIIGYGNIGSQVSVLCEALGMKVLFYDTETKLPLGNAVAAKNMKEVLMNSDIVSLHVPETPQTKNLINRNNIKLFKKGSILLNYARGEVVDLKALSEAIKEGVIAGAGIDVYPWEPEKNGDHFDTPLQGLPNVILTPHIGGSTEEAQQNIGEDVSVKLFQYLERGITNGSHTVPAIGLPPVDGAHRILHVHKNVPGVLSAINTALSKNNINIVGQYLKTNEEIGYVVLDVDKKLSKRAAELLKEVKETIKVRMLY